MSKDIIDRAAEWWAIRLRTEAGIGDNGGRDVSSVMAMGMTRMIRERNPITNLHAARFESELRAQLQQAFELVCEHEAKPLAGRGSPPNVGCNWYFDNNGWDAGGPDLCLAVDYHPCELLLRALATAGVERNVREVAALPLKTCMRVSRRRIIVKAGYGAPFTDIACAWGSSYDERRAAEDTRDDAAQQAYEAWRADGHRGPTPQWFGPLREPFAPREARR